MTASSYTSGGTPPPPGSTSGARTVCFDLDGTLCTNTFGAYESAEPFGWAIARVNALADAGHRIVVFTARGTATGIDWEATTRAQLERWGVRYDDLRLGKPSADVYVDDRAVHTDSWRAGDAFEVPGLGLPVAPGAEALPSPAAPWRTAVVETGRTFGGQPFLLDAHVARLCALAAGAGLAPPPAADELAAAVHTAVGARPGPDTELAFALSISGPADAAYLDILDGPVPPVVRAEVRPLAEVAAGLAGLVTPGPGPVALSATTARGAGWPLERRADGSLAAGLGGRLAVVDGGAVVLEREAGPASVLTGWLEAIAADAGVEVRDGDLHEGDLRGAEETFVACLPFGLVGVAGLDGVVLPAGGAARAALAAAWSARVGLDIDEQLARLVRGAARPAP